MHDRLAAADAQEARQQGRGGCAIDIVVAEDRNLLAARHGVGETQRRLFHRGDGVRIGHQPPHRRIEKGFDLVDFDATAGKNARQQLRHIVPLRDGERPRRRALIEPVPPRSAADRTLDTEKQARCNLWRQRQGGRHDFSHQFETIRRLYSAALQRTPLGRGVATIHRRERKREMTAAANCGTLLPRAPVRVETNMLRKSPCWPVLPRSLSRLSHCRPTPQRADVAAGDGTVAVFVAAGAAHALAFIRTPAGIAGAYGCHRPVTVYTPFGPRVRRVWVCG